MTYKPVDTAIVMTVGPCIDDTDFKSLEEAIAYDAAGMDISLIVEKTDGTSAVTAITLTTAGTSDWTHKDGGYYEVEITAAQNAEEGIAYIRGVCTGVLPFESPRYDIVAANIYDSLVKGTDKLEVDLTQMGGVAQSATDLKTFADAGYDPITNKIQGVLLTDTTTTNSDMRGTDSAALAATVHCPTAGTILTGSQVSGSYSNICVQNSSYWVISHSGHVIDVQLQYDLGRERTPTYLECVFFDAGGSTIDFYGYNYLTASWDKLNYLTIPDPTGGLIYLGVSILRDHKSPDYRDNAGRVLIRIVESGSSISRLEINKTVIHSADSTLVITGQQLSLQGKLDVNAECDTALSDYGANTTTPPTVTEIRTEMDTNSTKMAPSQILGDYKATGFSTHAAADIWSVGTRALTDKSGFDLSTAGINALWDDLISDMTQIGSIGKLIADNLNATITSRAPASEYDTQMGYIPSNLGDVPIASELNTTHGAGSWATATGFNTVTPDPAGTAATLHITTDGKVDAVQTDVTAVKAKTDNLPSGMAKNVAVPKFDVFMVSSSDHVTGATGKTVTGTISKDGGSFAALTNAITEVSGGLYTMASGLTQAERNADVSTLVFTADGCDDLVITIISS